MIKIDMTCNTSGRGLWSKQAKSVHINGLEIAYENDEENFGELQVRFLVKSWDIETYGLIYTDPLWIQEFRLGMHKKFNLSFKAVNDIDYSEQGMQGRNYVSLDVGEAFLKEWKKADAAVKRTIP